MKKRLQLIAGVIIVIILGTVTWLTGNKKTEEVSVPAETESIETEDRIDDYLFSVSRDEIDSIGITEAGNTLLFTKENNYWNIDEIPEDFLNTQTISALVNEISHLQALETMENDSADKSLWGLENPKRIIEIKTASQSIKFYLGNKSPGGSGYYLEDGTSGKIHLISLNSGDILKLTRTAFIKQTLKTMKPEQINAICLTNTDGSKQIEIKKGLKPDMFTADVFSYWVTAPYPYVRPANQKTLDTELKKLQRGPYIMDLAEENQFTMTKTLLLENPEGNQYSLQLSETDSNGNIMARDSRSGQILILKADSIPFLNCQPFSLLDSFPHLVALNNIDQICFRTSAAEITGEITRNDAENSYTIQKNPVSKEQFMDFYQTLLYLQLEGEVENPDIVGQTEYELSFRLTGSKNVYSTLYFRNAGSDYLSVARNEEKALFLIGRYQLEEISRKLEKYF